jgi:uncharacterized protein (DUF2336 family)
MSEHVLIPTFSPPVRFEAPPTADERDVVLLRKRLLKRLMDVVALPASRTSVQDRAIAGDLLLELLIEAPVEDRMLCARRLKDMSLAPKRLLRFLALDDARVAELILPDNGGFDESDLAYVALNSGTAQRVMVARRAGAGPSVSRAIAATGDMEAAAALLLNETASISDQAMDQLVLLSREATNLTGMLARRPEMRPAQALAMFWWCTPGVRRDILTRFSAERSLLIDECSDIFREAAAVNGWSDPVLRKALHVIERRQRNRGAIKRSPYASLEDAVTAAATQGLDPTLIDEISYLCGIRPSTGERILSDAGGEGLAILCKATGLKRGFLRDLWNSLGRTGREAEQTFERVSEIYEMLAVARAQTVLRYWNWSLASAFSIEISGTSEGTSADAPSPESKGAKAAYDRLESVFRE